MDSFSAATAIMKRLAIILAAALLPQYVCAVTPYFGLSTGRFNGTPELASAFTGGAEAGFEYRGFAIYAGADITQQELRDTLEPSGTITLTPVQMGIDGLFRSKKGLSARFGASVGYGIADFQLSKKLERENELSRAERLAVDVRNDVCFQIRGGVGRQVSKHTSISFEVSYFVFETRLLMERIRKDAQYRYPSSSPIDFNSIIGKIVLRFK